jgi:hypothetical protein
MGELTELRKHMGMPHATWEAGTGAAKIWDKVVVRSIGSSLGMSGDA